MQLSSEDSLKLNVLVSTAEAVRIDEGKMWVLGLTGDDVARVELHPTGPKDQYLRCVRAFLATWALGSPAGYPMHLKHWTRLGEIRNTDPQSLLMLGEEEAAVAASRIPDLSDEVARRVWWVVPTTEVARFLLAKPAVIAGRLGPILVNHLIDYLPYETEPIGAIESIGLILDSGLLEPSQVIALWQKAKRCNYYYVGFLRSQPRTLPIRLPAHRRHAELARRLAGTKDRCAREFLYLLSDAGQTFLNTCERVLSKPSDQDVVVALLDAMSTHFERLRHPAAVWSDVTELVDYATQQCTEARARSTHLAYLVNHAPEWQDEIAAMLILIHADERLVRHQFARSDAVGSVMRKKLAPTIAPLVRSLQVLLDRGNPAAGD